MFVATIDGLVMAFDSWHGGELYTLYVDTDQNGMKRASPTLGLCR